MPLVFPSLYDLALELLTAPSESPLHNLTAHHFESREDAERILRASILKDTMPGESNQTDWGITRIFLFNLINRAQAPMTWVNLSNLLNEVESVCLDAGTEAMQDLLMKRLANNTRLHASLSAFLNPQRAPNQTKTYTEWLRGLINSYGQTSVDQIDPANVLGNIHAIAIDPSTRIPNMGIPLAANLLADLGIKSSVKPDLHVRPTIRGLKGNPGLSDAAIINSVIVMAQEEAPHLRAMPNYSWINEAGGLYPRHIDRLIYLIGSDNFLLNGRRYRLRAPQRRQWMLNSLTTR